MESVIESEFIDFMRRAISKWQNIMFYVYLSREMFSHNYRSEDSEPRDMREYIRVIILLIIHGWQTARGKC